MSEIIKESGVFLECDAKTVDEVLEFLSDKAIELGLSDDRDAVLAAFKERESMGTTGMMGGFAIPHAKTNAVPEPAVIAVKVDGVDWESMDGKPIKMAIALLMPDNEAGVAHLRTLSKVATMLMGDAARDELLGAADAATVAALINKAVAAA